MKNIVWHSSKVEKNNKEQLLGQKPCILWFTGLSGSGKSTVAVELEKRLFELNKFTTLLDGDNIRHGLCSDLGFSTEERRENLRRIREVAKLFYDNAAMTLVSFISPLQEERDNARQLIGEDFIEIFIDCPIEECAKRDPKGLYKKAQDGEIKNFTGIGQGYERPTNPDILINTSEVSVDEAVETIMSYLQEKKYI